MNSYRVRGDIILEKIVGVIADSEKEAERIATAHLKERLEDLLVTRVSAWSHDVETEFTWPDISTDITAFIVDDEDDIEDWALTSEDYPDEKV
jgi:hypothetical protein|tara:strand:- start:473 stop:751 length:279 start_codon:yes stop_codon:yes gene_type:complete